MTTSPFSTVIGVFPSHEQANSAIDDLRHANFSYGRIRLVERGTGRFMDTLKGMFTGQAATASSTSDSLVKMGMPDHDAQYYQGELDADHVLLLMNADDRPEDAFGILRQNGAYDISARLKTPLSDSTVGTQDQAQYTTAPATPNGTYPNGTQGAYDPAPEVAATYPNGNRGTYNPAPATSDATYQNGSQPAYNNAPVAPDATYPRTSQEVYNDPAAPNATYSDTPAPVSPDDDDTDVSDPNVPRATPRNV